MGRRCAVARSGWTLPALLLLGSRVAPRAWLDVAAAAAGAVPHSCRRSLLARGSTTAATSATDAQRFVDAGAVPFRAPRRGVPWTTVQAPSSSWSPVAAAAIGCAAYSVVSFRLPSRGRSVKCGRVARMEGSASSLACDLNRGFWEEIGEQAGLTITSSGGCHPQDGAAINTDSQVFREKMLQDGYVELPQPQLGHSSPDTLLRSLATAIDRLGEADVPAQFLFMFDEVWAAMASVGAPLESAFGLHLNMDLFVFDVKPGASGWMLHRDRPGPPHLGFKMDGLPEYINVWLAITEATPENSCIYCLPKRADPEYGGPGDVPSNDEWELRDDLEEDEDWLAQADLESLGEYPPTLSGEHGSFCDDMALHELEAEDEEHRGSDEAILAANHQDIRALPTPAGGALAWSHRLLHWGSASRADAKQARKALAFAMAADSFEEPLLALSSGKLPSYEARLALVAFSLVVYHHNQPLPSKFQAQILGMLRDHYGHLNEAALAGRTSGGTFIQNLQSMRMEAEASQVGVIDSILESVFSSRGAS